MKIQVSTNIKLSLTELKYLDSITIYLENFEPGRGKITIECFGKSWSSFWPAMGGRRVEEFYVSCNDEYLAKNLSDCRSHIPVTAPSELCNYLRPQIINQRRAGELKKEQARRFWEEAETITLASDYCSNTELMHDVLGDDWWLSLPERENPDYNYLIRVIRAVREGLRQYIAQGPEAE